MTFNRARRSGGKLPPVPVQAVYVKEDAPPLGEEALAWLRLPNLAVADFATAPAVLDGYRARWEMARPFRFLKQGCNVEAWRLETAERLEKGIAVDLIVAWRLHPLNRSARRSPDVAGTELFSAEEWRTLYLLQTRQRPPKKPPTRQTITRMLAQLGGLLARQGDGEPGPETLWRGYLELLRAMKALSLTKAAGL